MPLPLIRYPLDITGINVNNKVVDEVKTLGSTNRYRIAAPSYGPFFAESFIIYDEADSRLLVRGIDYSFGELLQEACIKTGKEIYNFVIIDTSLVSANVRYTYQVLGGYYQYNAEAIVDMYETFLNDDRPVNWVNVLNKPLYYNPTLHNHYISEQFGFETIISAIERLRNAVVLSDVPAFEELINYVNARALPSATEQDIDNGIGVNKVITLERLLYALKKFNFNTITISPSKAFLLPNVLQTYSLTTTNIDDGTPLYWTIDHINTSINDFSQVNGIVYINDNKGSFSLKPLIANITEDNENFRIQLRRNSVSGPVIFTSNVMTVLGTYIISTDDIIQCLLDQSMYVTNLPLTPETIYLIHESKDPNLLRLLD